jgi:hypothetical protein
MALAWAGENDGVRMKFSWLYVYNLDILNFC